MIARHLDEVDERINEYFFNRTSWNKWKAVLLGLISFGIHVIEVIRPQLTG